MWNARLRSRKTTVTEQDRITATSFWCWVCCPGPRSSGAARDRHFHAGKWKKLRTPRALLDTVFLYLEVMQSCLESERKEQKQSHWVCDWRAGLQPSLLSPCASAGVKRVGEGERTLKLSIRQSESQGVPGTWRKGQTHLWERRDIKHALLGFFLKLSSHLIPFSSQL